MFCCFDQKMEKSVLTPATQIFCLLLGCTKVWRQPSNSKALLITIRFSSSLAENSSGILEIFDFIVLKAIVCFVFLNDSIKKKVKNNCERRMMSVRSGTSKHEWFMLKRIRQNYNEESIKNKASFIKIHTYSRTHEIFIFYINLRILEKKSGWRLMHLIKTKQWVVILALERMLFVWQINSVDSR